MHHTNVPPVDLVLSQTTSVLCLCSTHWSLIHQVLLDALLASSDQASVHFGHKVTQIEQSASGSSVTAKVSKALPGGKSEELSVAGDLLVASDGSMSQTRAQYIPNEPRRYVSIWALLVADLLFSVSQCASASAVVTCIFALLQSWACACASRIACSCRCKPGNDFIWLCFSVQILLGNLCTAEMQ